MRIEGKHPAEYAAQWGDGSTNDGMLFYNCSEAVPDHPNRVRPNSKWDAAQWARFVDAIRAQGREVRRRIETGQGDRFGWTKTDALNLARLARWGASMILKTSYASDVDRAASAYIECALWTVPDYAELGMAEQSGEFDASEYLPRVTRSMRSEAREVCAQFMAENTADLAEWEAGQIGHDLWLTRNGHGAGFWDRKTGTREARERLSESARKLGERDVYRRRGWFYFDFG